MKPHDAPTIRSSFSLAAVAVACAIVLSACGGGGAGFAPPAPPPPTPVEPPPPTTPILSKTANLPGVKLDIVAVTGGSGPGGNVLPGDTLAVEFTLERNDGTPIPVPDMNTLRIYVSGPSFNYQIVIARQNDGRARSVQTPSGSWIYTFGIPIPAAYDVPPNDSPSFGPSDGEMAGDPLIPGTYTVGMEGYKLYSIDGVDYRDVANATADFLLGSATMIEHREVVKIENCRRCHIDVRAHGGTRREVKNCVLCHVSGAEDGNNPANNGGTPGVSIDLRVMIHKIHMGEHLPSVNGVATNPNGSRDYDATPTPYIVAGGGTSASDFSHVPFPVWPNLTFPMPRDQGFSMLTASQQAQEDMIRTGVTKCDKCHGDPDGPTGPLTAPAQGGNAYADPTPYPNPDPADPKIGRLGPSRRACGACHDDVDFTKSYAANLLSMPPQTDDISCRFCHGQTGGMLNPATAHVHPINDPAANPGVNFNILSWSEAGMHNGDGRIQPGEKLQVSFEMKDDAGNQITTAAWAAGGSVNVLIAGPTTNRQLLLTTSLPLAAVTGSPPYTIRVPEVVVTEYVGDSTAAGSEMFTTSRAPHLNVTGALTTVVVRTATGSAATASAPIRAVQNYIDLVPGFNTVGTGGFSKDKFVVIDDNVPGKEEYLKIQYVDGNRIWFGQIASTSYQPATRFSHATGATVQVVTLTTKTAGTHFTLNAAAGQITEGAGQELGTGEVIVTYTSDFIMPAVYPTSINDSPDLDETWGEWESLPIESGTYTVGFYASKTFNYAAFGETQSYRNTSVNDEAQANFLVGTATVIQPETIISSKDNCNACHDTVYAHGGGREGYNTCILCHGSAGGEDRPRYVAPGAPASMQVTIEFRSMLHKIHMGENLTQAATWQVIGFGSGAYPNNFGINMYDEVAFPAMPDGVKNCEKCHGVGNGSWKVPTDRSHSASSVAAKSWRTVCNSCHDADAVEAHIKAQTSPSGVESCSVCHGPGAVEDVSIAHKIR